MILNYTIESIAKTTSDKATSKFIYWGKFIIKTEVESLIDPTKKVTNTQPVYASFPWDEKFEEGAVVPINLATFTVDTKQEEYQGKVTNRRWINVRTGLGA